MQAVTVRKWSDWYIEYVLREMRDKGRKEFKISKKGFVRYVSSNKEYDLVYPKNNERKFWAVSKEFGFICSLMLLCALEELVLRFSLLMPVCLFSQITAQHVLQLSSSWQQWNILRISKPTVFWSTKGIRRDWPLANEKRRKKATGIFYMLKRIILNKTLINRGRSQGNFCMNGPQDISSFYSEKVWKVSNRSKGDQCLTGNDNYLLFVLSWENQILHYDGIKRICLAGLMTGALKCDMQT